MLQFLFINFIVIVWNF